jgi:membrane protease YdiL (CAAX protease family)
LPAQPVSGGINGGQHGQHPGTAIVVGRDAGELESPEPGLLRGIAEANAQRAVAPDHHRNQQVPERHSTKLQRDFRPHRRGDQRCSGSEAQTLPVEVFALAATLLILLPTALWVTSITDGRAGVRALFAPVFRWRFGIGWWLVVLFGLPVIALVLGLLFGGSLHTADLGPVLLKQLGFIVLAVVVINLWEETVWAGFFQTRLEARFNFILAAVLTALPFAGVHVPLLLLDDQVSALKVLIGIAGLLILGMVVRLLMGVMMRAASDSVLAVGILHQIFDASNNNGGLVDSVLDGADAGDMTQLAAVVLTVLVAAWLLWRRPGAFAKRHIPLQDARREVG